MQFLKFIIYINYFSSTASPPQKNVFHPAILFLEFIWMLLQPAICIRVERIFLLHIIHLNSQFYYFNYSLQFWLWHDFSISISFGDGWPWRPTPKRWNSELLYSILFLLILATLSLTQSLYLNRFRSCF